MADVAKAMVPRVVEKRNLNEVVALLEMQIESLTGHERTLESYAAFIQRACV